MTTYSLLLEVHIPDACIRLRCCCTHWTTSQMKRPSTLELAPLIDLAYWCLVTPLVFSQLATIVWTSKSDSSNFWRILWCSSDSDIPKVWDKAATMEEWESKLLSGRYHHEVSVAFSAVNLWSPLRITRVLVISISSSTILQKDIKVSTIQNSKQWGELCKFDIQLLKHGWLLTLTSQNMIFIYSEVCYPNKRVEMRQLMSKDPMLTKKFLIGYLCHQGVDQLCLPAYQQNVLKRAHCTTTVIKL